MRGFFSTAAAMIFVFSLVTAMYSFTAVQPDFGDAARIGLAIESARWAVESDNFQCQNLAYDGSIFNNAMASNVLVNGDISNITHDTDFTTIDLDLIVDYAPSAFLSYDGIELNWTVCDPAGGLIGYKLVNGTHLFDRENIDSGDSASFIPPGPGTYFIEVNDTNGNIGYSNRVTVP